MRKILLLFAAIVIALGVSAKENNDTTVCFKISPAMSCANCENKIKSNLRFEKGVTAIEATAPGDQVTVSYNKTKTDASKIENAFSKIGYKATLEGAKTCEKQDSPVKGCCGSGCKKQEVKTCCKKEVNSTEEKTCCKEKKETK